MVEQERLGAQALARPDTIARDRGYLRAVLDNAVDELIAIDAQGIVRSFNTAAEPTFGYRAAGAIFLIELGVIEPLPGGVATAQS